MNRPHTQPPLQRTAGGKTHFDVLDGLRGTAALLVVVFHLQGIGVAFAHDKLILPHAYLAVDFFFALSGFVIGYAYDDRWSAMSTRQFFMARLIRLHPLVVAGAVLGVLSYLFGPFASTAQTSPLPLVLAAFALCLLVLPAPMLENRWHDTHPINGPSWSLLQEYIANIAYALILRSLSVRALCIVASVAWVALAGGALAAGSLDIGYGWDNLWGAPLRLAYPFTVGLLVYRTHHKLAHIRLGLIPLSIIMTGLFCFPSLGEVGGVKLSALYDLFCVSVMFPTILLLGIHSEPAGWRAEMARWFGRISYPLYITHFPMAFVFLNYTVSQKPSPPMALAAGVATFVAMVVFALAILRYFDEPVRARLRKRWLAGKR
ncbi:acyltransferase family protein [Xanthomonas codiaei]|uniref:Acyltransferase family protein n=1 Tax=Xanthomonas codiaei TaxID=56463 RepID=A0A2S7CEF3_9XANT|nr:acyltransferase [Xanthomonas codiaei]PPU59957.1 hypothetical protein XcodCFBP4690_18520 [Xanthomonas codiaei]